MAKSQRKNERKSERKKELIGVGLLALAVFVLLTLLPTALLGSLEATWFPSGNLMGVVGHWFRTGAVYLFGGGAWLLPALVALAGIHLGGWIARERAVRLAILGLGLLVLLPGAFFVLSFPPEWPGRLGVGVGLPLAGALGVFGASFFLAVAFVLLSLATLGWNPLQRPAFWLLKGAKLAWERGAGWLEGRHIPEMRTPAPAVVVEEARPFEREPVVVKEPVEAADVEAEEPEPERAVVPATTTAAPSRKDILHDPRDPRELAGDELPPLDLLDPSEHPDRREMERDLDALGEVLVEKLRTFSVESTLGGRTTGPVVTQFEVIPAPGVKVNRIANLDRDLALAMKAKTIRIVAPIPGKGAVGVEIPNPLAFTVRLREILESRAFGGSRAELPLGLGKDLSGDPYVADLARMPHALIAGATGSGKSVCLNTIITSLVYRHTPETLRLLLIDPKMVELSTYADLPHLRHSVVTDPKEAAGVLKWALIEMERRYALLSANGVRSISEFNRRVRKGSTLKRVEADGDEGDPDRWIYTDGILPFVVLVVDELADLMMTVQSEIEKPLTQIAQKARAIGLHLIVATQRPSVNVVTGLIKANFPSRIAFRVASKTDSRTILDQNGADVLLGDGDMLFLPPGQSEPVRIQGAYISTEETERLIGWYRELRERKLAAEEGAGPAVEEDILEVVRAREIEQAGGGEEVLGGEWDEYFREAAEICITNDQGSTSLLQRKLRIGYGRAARIVDQLHDSGVLGPPDGSKPREVLINLDQLDRMFGGGRN
ncbi:MAG: DNA translocase FtsK [Gemmatimonadota bacterium]